jgi:hypothetical protein
MKVNVPDWAMDHFSEEPPPDTVSEFWAFRFQPKCKPGDPIQFFHNGKMLATATVLKIEPPGESACSTTGRFKNRWKVHWALSSFEEVKS